MLNQIGKLLLLLFYLVILAGHSFAQNNPYWPTGSQSSKPWTRWWWMGNAVSEQDILRELKEFNSAGIGGVEITSIYGVKGEEENFINFLSPEFSDILNYTIDQAAKLNMGVDLPSGSGWRNGGPFVPKEKGLWNLDIKKYKLNAGETWSLIDDDRDNLAISFVSGGTSEKVTAPFFKAEKSGAIYVAKRVKSKDKVKRPAKGGEGWAIDTFNEAVTNWYLAEFWKRLNIRDGKIRCFFHDSFEYTGDFTTNFLQEFKNRRGYSLEENLHVLLGDCENFNDVARIKSDYRETLADLVLESFIKPMTDWANQHKALNRNQAHGSPGNILDLYAACDIPETEFFGRLEVNNQKYFIQKFASSAAHVTGKKLVSSESFTWLDEHWTVTPTEMLRATNGLFLAGVNHIFFQGTCYSPQNVSWPGWLFYASTQLNNRNPLWREMPSLFKYIERSQSIFQQSTSCNDVLVYWPYYDVAAEKGQLFNHIGVNKIDWFYQQPIAKLSKQLTDAGYTFDFISDKQLLKCKMAEGQILSPGKSKYKAIVIPECKYIPVASMNKLTELLSDEGKVVFNTKFPKSVPGLFQWEKRENELKKIEATINKKWLGNSIKILAEVGVAGEKDLASKGLKYVKCKIDTEDYYWIFNSDSKEKDEWIKLHSAVKNYVFMNPMSGEVNLAETKDNLIHLQLEPEQAIFVRCADKASNIKPFVYKTQTDKTLKINTVWDVEFITGGPVLPINVQIDKLISWTDFADKDAQRFAGTVKYSTHFNWSGESNSNVINLGTVKDCAHVYLNDVELGALLGPTFKIQTDKLIKGENTLVVEVSNVAANRIRDLDIRGVKWRKFYDINFVNIDYKPFDASGWEIRDAGLFGPVTITENTCERIMRNNSN